MSKDEVRGHLFRADSRPLTEIVAVHHIQWFGHILLMFVHRLCFRAIFAVVDKAGRSELEASLTWRRCVRKSASALFSVGASRLRDWSLRDVDRCRLETLRDMTQCRSQRDKCCRAYL